MCKRCSAALVTPMPQDSGSDSDSSTDIDSPPLLFFTSASLLGVSASVMVSVRLLCLRFSAVSCDQVSICSSEDSQHLSAFRLRLSEYLFIRVDVLSHLFRTCFSWWDWSKTCSPVPSPSTPGAHQVFIWLYGTTYVGCPIMVFWLGGILLVSTGEPEAQGCLLSYQQVQGESL